MVRKTTKKTGALSSPAVIEVIDEELKVGTKYQNRVDIQDNVFDNSDSIADNAKMISLMLSMMSRMYDVMPQEQKDTIPAVDKGMIDYMFAKFSTSNTRADIQFSLEGTALIDKLIDRQVEIGVIIS